MTTCDDSDVATVAVFTDAACTTAKQDSGADVTVTYNYAVTCAAAADGSSFEYKVAATLPAVVDCPTLKASLFTYTATSGEECSAALEDGDTKTAAEAAYVFDTTGECVNTVAKVDAVTADAAADPPVEEVVGVDAEYTKTTCKEDKTVTVAVYTDDACESAKQVSSADVSTTYNYDDETCVASGTDYAYKLASVEAPAGDAGSALMASTVAALALIASQF